MCVSPSEGTFSLSLITFPPPPLSPKTGSVLERCPICAHCGVASDSCLKRTSVRLRRREVLPSSSSVCELASGEADGEKERRDSGKRAPTADDSRVGSLGMQTARDETLAGGARRQLG
ncbi:hypothetical protein L249_2940 [Ophiocordyceps polyrhachis-furcata BCC 54312]|uniref:Uncharacterized protein n=1 Tax=Ophiocordyceps polyrhachis-furcata BCC 54312 TaxID=1330021 RepID=A0A367LRA2_9HYPO|nr:hypothetical protein L249_2940 [Ophiocordyceps polyrhachis-furcata BCC 54312]